MADDRFDNSQLLAVWGEQFNSALQPGHKLSLSGEFRMQ
jgi:hypothetical protein